MAFKRPMARILERTTSAGNGPYTLLGAVDGSYNAFSAFMSVGDVTFVSVVEPNVAFWTGVATYSATNQITLTSVEETKGTFGAGTKEIMSGPLASGSMFPQDISGQLTTTGTSTAYAIASYRKYPTLAAMDGNIIAFTPHVTNGATVTLAVDGLAAKPLRLAPGVELQSNTLIAGTPYLALYNHSSQVFYLHMLGGNTYGLPLASGVDYWAATTPSSAFAFPVGQALNRVAFASLFALIGTSYGSGLGDGLTFSLPNKSGRVSAGADNMSGSPAGILDATGGMNGSGRGSIGGTQTQNLTIANIASFTPTGSFSGSFSGNATIAARLYTQTGGASDLTHLSTGNNAGADAGTFSAPVLPGTISGSISMNPLGSNTPHGNVQPTITCNYIMRVL